MTDHHEVVQAHHRFSGVAYFEEPWDLSHLDAFAIRVDPGLGYEVDVVILFSCHCFTKSYKSDGRAFESVPVGERFDNGRESRVLCPTRYALSKRFLPHLIKDLPTRSIQFARNDPLNFITIEMVDESAGGSQRYAIFFEVTRDSKRRKRVLLHVQSAYLLDELTKRQAKAGKVKFATLVKAVYENRKLKD